MFRDLRTMGGSVPMIEFLNLPKYKSFEECVEEINLMNNNIFGTEPSFVRQGLYYKQIKDYLT